MTQHKPNTLSDADAILRLEAIIFASETAISLQKIKQAFDATVSLSHIRRWLDALAAQQNNRAIELVETAQGYRFQVRDTHSAVIAQLWPERPLKLSNALLETLAVIAYHQPVTRSDIERIRGVSVNSQILKTLFEREWIIESGVRDVAGRPALLVTTQYFLNAFGLQSLTTLPSLDDAKEVLSTPTALVAVDGPAGNPS